MCRSCLHSNGMSDLRVRSLFLLRKRTYRCQDHGIFHGEVEYGPFSVASDEFFAEYRDGGRGATQYQLNLTPAAKQRLWKILDDKVAEGANLPYDYNRRGCAKSACEAIMAALKGERVQCAFWNPNVSPTRREKFCEELFASSPWNLFCLNAIVGTEVDNVEEVVTPKDLLAFLRKTHVNGIPILTDGGREIFPAQPRGKASWFTPLVAAALLAALCAANVFFRFGWFDAVILILQGLCGAFFLYLMSASRLPTSCWNWLVVPFNPIAPLLWWLRPRWSLWFVGILLAWETLMVASTHPLTDRAFLLLAIALMITYAKRGVVVCVRR